MRRGSSEQIFEIRIAMGISWHDNTLNSKKQKNYSEDPQETHGLSRLEKKWEGSRGGEE